MRLAFLPLLLLAAPAAAGPDVRAMLITMARAGNCVITDDQAEMAFDALGLTKEQIRPVAEAMFASGEASLVDNRFHLSPTLCSADAAAPPAAPPVPGVTPLMGRVIAVFAANGCAMSEAQGMSRLAAAGITEDQLGTLRDETERLVAAGLIDRNEETRTITIAAPLCQSPTVLSDPAEPLIRMLRENGCALTQDAAVPLMARYGLTMQTADEMADSLMDRGLARGEGERLVLEGCGG